MDLENVKYDIGTNEITGEGCFPILIPVNRQVYEQLLAQSKDASNIRPLQVRGNLEIKTIEKD